jgi:hypothetical protein
MTRPADASGCAEIREYQPFINALVLKRGIETLIHKYYSAWRGTCQHSADIFSGVRRNIRRRL